VPYKDPQQALKYSREYQKLHPEIGRKSSKKWLSKPENKAKRALYAKTIRDRAGAPFDMHSHARRRAKKEGVPFDLLVGDIVVPERCPVLGVELKRGKGTGIGPSPNSPTLDRKVPALGYVKGNVWVISCLANRMKTNSTPEQRILFSDWVQSGERVDRFD
jgi:hypothetical protein